MGHRKRLGAHPVTRTLTVRAAAALTAVLLVSGCTASAATKAGAGIVPVTLRMGTVEQQSNTPYAPEVLAFADAVAHLSDGTLTIDVEWEQSAWRVDSEPRVAEAARRGEIDLALVPTRTFSEIGVQRFNALQTPFLIVSPELSVAVAKSPVAEAMLSDLAEHGLIGLALMHESMRRPIAFEAPLLTADDYRDAVIRTPASEVGERLLRQIGARPVASEGYYVGTSGEVIEAAESAYDWVAALPRGSTATADVAFYPKVNVLVAFPATWSALTPEHQHVIRRAAAQARDDGAATMSDEIAVAGEYCLAGGALAFAGEDARAELVKAASPVRSWLETDPVVAADILAIEKVKAATPVSEFVVPWQCRPPRGDWAPWPVSKAGP